MTIISCLKAICVDISYLCTYTFRGDLEHQYAECSPRNMWCIMLLWHCVMINLKNSYQIWGEKILLVLTRPRSTIHGQHNGWWRYYHDTTHSVQVNSFMPREITVTPLKNSPLLLVPLSPHAQTPNTLQCCTGKLSAVCKKVCSWPPRHIFEPVEMFIGLNAQPRRKWTQ